METYKSLLWVLRYLNQFPEQGLQSYVPFALDQMRIGLSNVRQVEAMTDLI